MGNSCVTSVIEAHIGKECEHGFGMFFFEFRHLNQRHHKCEIEDLKCKCDINLCLNLLNQRLNEPLNRHLRVLLEQILEVRKEEFADSGVIRPFY